MQWELVIALVIAVPIILFPAAYIWYLNASGIYSLTKEARAKRAARERKSRNQEQIDQAKEVTVILDEVKKLGGSI